MPSGYVPTTAEEKADAEAARDHGGDIHDAVRHGDLPAARHIVRSDAEAVHQKKNGMTALFASASNDDLSIAQFLVQSKADVNAKRNNGWTALIFAADRGHLSIAQFLVKEKADVNAKDNGGWTALYASACNDHLSIAQFLVQSKADVNAKRNDGWTALMLAASSGHLSIAQFLVKEKADVNAKNYFGRGGGQTALDRARENRRTDVVAFLERAAKEEDSKAKDTPHLEAELAATKAELERMQLTAASPSTSGGYAGQAFATAPAPKASSQAAGSEAIPDGAAAPVSMFSARFNGGEFELKFREVHRLLREHNFDSLMVNADAGDNFGTLTLEYLGRVQFENGVMLCVCTEDYGEVTKSKYSSNFELQYIYDQNLRKIPIRVVLNYPTRPDCGPHHMYDKSYSARVLVNSVFRDSVVFLDCQEKTAHEIALMLAKKLLAM